ncbi:tail protein X [Bosea minatitlanensis]|uniref:Tail protein X n=1 Tax=Bosea minatitlanensis TaxID=128782 RepID=A0ABW0EYN9_9HYPH|nr:tail protein X [Bosea minatitlanensis]MCT4491819.1 tail protein X [Bosea minatitlanensis]
MASVKVVQDAMTLDLLVWRALGRQDQRLVEQTLALNPGLASAGTILSVGTVVVLPEPPAATARIRETVKLWS